MPLRAQSIAVSQEVLLKNDNAYAIVGKYDENIILMREFDNEINVHSFDEQLLQRWERTLEFEKKNAQVHSIVPTDSSFHIIYGYRDKGDYLLRRREYDPTVAILDSALIYMVPDLFFSPKFRNAVSEDRSKLLLFRIDKESELHVSVFDMERKEVIWQKLIIFETGSLRRDFRDVMVSNRGDMLLVMDHERNSMRNKQFIVLRVDAQSKVLRKNYVKLDKVHAYDLHPEFDNVNNTLWMSGLYTEKAMGKALGLYTIKLGLYSDRSEKRLYRFDDELLGEVTGSKNTRKKGLLDFIVKDIILRHDGGAVILAEMSKEYSRRPNTPARTMDYGRGGWTDFYYEDVIVFSVHPDGTEHWNTVLHKKQYSQDDGGMYSSYFPFKTDEKLRLLFNDEIRQNSTVSEYVIRGNGYHKRRSVFSTDYQRLRLRFQDAVQVAYNECIVPSERSNRLNLVRITFAD